VRGDNQLTVGADRLFERQREPAAEMRVQVGVGFVDQYDAMAGAGPENTTNNDQRLAFAAAEILNGVLVSIGRGDA